MTKTDKYPVGEQSFSSLIEEGFLYVDKTRFIEKIISEGKYYFLGRPRRFGKSLFLSTLKCFFEGRRELFKGLYADSMDWDWEPCPVFHISLNTMDYTRPGKLDVLFNAILSEWEHKYGLTSKDDDISLRFRNIIKRACEVTGKKVVILVDEYDNPLVDSLDNSATFDDYRNQLSAIYSNFKSSADYIRLVFLTGVSRFGKISVFSGLNNLKDISFRDEFSDICGITEDELLANFKDGLSRYAGIKGVSYDNVVATLKNWYDGYHFSGNSPDIYNPFSILNFMDSMKIANYWISSGGMPTILINAIKRCDENLSRLFSSRCSEERLSGIDLKSDDPLPLLYQTGYLTIKSFRESSGICTLGLPNNEVKKGFIDFLLPYYANLNKQEPTIFIDNLLNNLEDGDADGFMENLESLFSGYSYEMKLENENNFHNVIYMILLLLGVHIETERRTSDGRIDLLITTSNYRYVIELKVDSTAEEALRQIDNKEYALQFRNDSRTVIKIGANFSTVTRRLTDWVVER